MAEIENPNIELELQEDSPYSDGYIDTFDDGTVALSRDADTPYTKKPGDRIHMVIEGDTISNLAGKYYNNSNLWHLIARANDGIDYFHLEPGIELNVPKLPTS